MKKIFLFLFLFLSFSAYSQVAQIPITSGMTGLQLRNALNDNFTYLWNKSGGGAVIDVKADYGAAGNGVTNDYAAILAALNYGISVSLPVYFPTGTYKVNSPLILDNVSRDNQLIILGNNATIDASGITDIQNHLFTIRGDTLTRFPITANIGLRDSIVYCNTVGKDILPEDVIQLISETDWGSFDYVDKGELCRVKRVEPTYIVIYDQFLDNYTTAGNTRIIPIQCGGVYIKDLKVIGRSDYDYGNGMFFIRSCQNVFLENLTVTKERDNGINLCASYNCRVKDCLVTGVDKAGGGYGIAVEGSQDVLVEGNEVKGCRHAIAITSNGAKADHPIPARNVIVSHNFVGSKGQTEIGSIDTHHGCEQIIIEDNIIFGGIALRNPNAVIRGNTVNGGSNSCINLDIYDDLITSNRDIKILNNHLIQRDTTLFFHGIQIIFQEGYSTYFDNIEISGNHIDVPGSDLITAYIDNAIGRVKSLTMRNNTMIVRALVNYPNIYIRDSLKVNRFIIDGEDYINYNPYDVLARFDYNIYFRSYEDTTDYISINNCHFQTEGHPIYIRYAKQLKVSNCVIVGRRFSDLSGTRLTVLNDNIFKKEPYAVSQYTKNLLLNDNWIEPSYKANIRDTATYLYTNEIKYRVTPTATNDGLTTGLLSHISQDITVTSANANNIICLPTTGATTVGMKITGRIGANGCELRVIAAQAGTVYINNVTTNVEAAIPANSSFEITCIDATHWLLKVWVADGTYSAPIPDAM